ncbi:MAG: hypothetical protein J6K53_01870 [Roseburia sp.]|nr:hypothetical protein [Roseburia sp.]
MEQIAFFLTEYAGEIAAGMGAFAIILLVTALHRIRRIEKCIQGIAGNPVLTEEDVSGQASALSESVNAGKVQKMKPQESAATAGIQEMTPQESAATAGIQEMKPQESADADGLLRKMTPQESTVTAGMQEMTPRESADADGLLRKMTSTETAATAGMQEATYPSARRLPQDDNQYREGRQGQNTPKPSSPGALIDEVLGEVFS